MARLEIVTTFVDMVEIIRGAAVSRLLPRQITRRQKSIALAVAAVADLLQLVLFPLFFEGALSPFCGALDVVVGIVLLSLLGWRWRTAAALAVELVPGLSLFPTWTAVVATMKSAPAELPAANETARLPAALRT